MKTSKSLAAFGALALAAAFTANVYAQGTSEEITGALAVFLISSS